MDPNDSIAVKDLIALTSPLIKSLVDTFVTPKLEAFRDRNTVSENDFVPTEQNFSEYYHRTYKRLAVVNTLVFNNSQRFLRDIYMPLTLSLVEESKVKKKYKIDGFPHKISDEYGNILITDTAGMGKSTMMKRIFIDCIESQLGIPIFIELRRLNREKTVLREIQEQLKSLEKEFDSKLLLKLLSEGGFIIILDGYDEISLTDREVVTADIQDFISKAGNNRFFITSRPEKALVSFGNFKEFRISPLKKKEAFELLRKYDSQGSISALLIKKLEEKEMSNIEEFMVNPLLVYLLFTAFEHKQAIPFKKYLFYRQVYDANFESHDLTKGDSYSHDKYSGLEIDDFHRVLRHIGFSCFKMQKIEFVKDELLKLISESKNFCAGIQFNESDFLEDLLRTVPLFTQDGNYYRWAHKSLQEYFAAQFIYLDSKEKQNAILQMLYGHHDSEKFMNVFDLYYDMDYKTFRNVIEFNLLKDYKEYSESNYCKSYLGIDDSLIKRRKELTFLSYSGMFYVEGIGQKGNDFDDRLADMINRIENIQLKFHRKFEGFFAHTATRNSFCIHFVHSKNTIIKLLGKKKNPVVAYVSRRSKDLRKINLNYTFKEEYEFILIDDDVENGFNSPENFEKMNFMLDDTRLVSYAIAHDNALERFEEISKSIEGESDKDFLLDGF